MSGSMSRRQAIKAVTTYEVKTDGFPEPLADTFGRNVFSLSVMKKRLPKHVYKAVAATIEAGASMDAALADYVAVAMKDWALEMGGHVRTGLEDNIRLDKHTLAPSNAALVTRTAELCAEAGRPVATVAQARAILGLPAMVAA